jgi:hypothetical protein
MLWTAGVMERSCALWHGDGHQQEVPWEILNHFWIQVVASLLKPSNGGFGSETVVPKAKLLQKYNGFM